MECVQAQLGCCLSQDQEQSIFLSGFNLNQPVSYEYISSQLKLKHQHRTKGNSELDNNKYEVYSLRYVEIRICYNRNK